MQLPRSLKYSRWILGALALLVLLTVGACNDQGNAPSQQAQDTKNNGDAAARLHKVEPYPVVTDSQELHNQRVWYQRLADPNKIAYLYLVTNQGQVFAEYQIRAKCSSTNSDYSSPAYADYNDGYTGGAPLVLPAAQPDGSYGANEQAVFCFLNDAKQTMIEFSEQWNYIWSEQPLNLTTAPVIVVVPNGH